MEIPLIFELLLMSTTRGYFPISMMPSSSLPLTPKKPFLTLVLIFLTIRHGNLCRSSCGGIPIQYPFGIDDGCGSFYYHRILLCSSNNELLLRTPSGKYPIRNITYTDPHLIVSDPLMWNCNDSSNFRSTIPFSLDISTHFSLSAQNDYLFFNCNESEVIMAPRRLFCEQFPQGCDSSCDTASYLCRHLPDCPSELGRISCCSYFPRAMESLRLMLSHCSSYTSVYWRKRGSSSSYDQVPEYGIRVDFQIPVTTACLKCQDSGGACGFDTWKFDFLCICGEGNTTSVCERSYRGGRSRRAVSGAVSIVSVAGAIGLGAGLWYLKRVRARAPTTCGIQSNENRTF